MKNLAIILASIFLLSTAALAGESKRSHKKSENTQVQLTEKITNMLSYPSYILNGRSEAIMISYSVDENNIIHVEEIMSPNIALKQYVLKHMDGKKIKNMHMEGKNGIVKVNFNGENIKQLNFQY